MRNDDFSSFCYEDPKTGLSDSNFPVISFVAHLLGALFSFPALVVTSYPSQGPSWGKRRFQRIGCPLQLPGHIYIDLQHPEILYWFLPADFSSELLKGG